MSLFRFCSLIGFVLLNGCNKFPQTPLGKIPKNITKNGFIDSAYCLIQSGQLGKASQMINLVLMQDAQSPILHILNGLIYEALSERGEKNHLELAGIAYQKACHLDPSSWHGMYLLGRYYARLLRYSEAQICFSKALLLRPHHDQTLHYLAHCAYYTQDFYIAEAAVDAVLKKQPHNMGIQCSAILIYGAVGRFEDAKATLEGLQKSKMFQKYAWDVIYLEERLNSWKNIHHRMEGPDFLDAFADNVHDHEENLKKELEENQEVLIEAYLLQVTETVRNDRGSNVLKNLMAESPTGAPPSISRTSEQITKDDSVMNTVNWKSNVGMQLGELKYNLNIANALEKNIQIVGRPILLATVGKPAKLQAGRMMSGLGSRTSELQNIPFGLTLQLNPTLIESNRVVLDVLIEGSLLPKDHEASADSSLKDRNVLYKRSSLSTTLGLKFNETGMLGGLYERIDSKESSGVPVLLNVPLLKYMFSHSVERSQRTSLMFYVTPRYKESLSAKIMSYLQANTYRQERHKLYKELCARENIQSSHQGDNQSPFPSQLKPELGYIRTRDVSPPSNHLERKIWHEILHIAKHELGSGYLGGTLKS